VAVEPPHLPTSLVPVTAGGDGEVDPRTDLDGAEWHEVFVEGDASGASAHRLRIDRSHLRRLALTGAELSDPRWTDVLVEDAELSGCVLYDATLTRVEFRRCRLAGVQLAEARLRDVAFVDCKLDEANLRLSVGERVTFRSCGLGGADLGGARIEEVWFFDSDLRGVDLSNAELPGARLHGSTFEGLRAADRLLRVTLDPAQVMPFAMALFGALGIRVDEEREPPVPRQRDQAKRDQSKRDQSKR
jgi:uncharacterized protein YjbI with pentapeptide repeats